MFLISAVKISLQYCVCCILSVQLRYRYSTVCVVRAETR